MFKLEKVFGLDNHECEHNYPHKIVLADAVDKDGGFIRVFYCTKCGDYRYKEVEATEEDNAFFSRVKKEKYLIYSTFEELHLLYK